ncbi:hypothetical protein ESCO_003930 [Escovopsis weberi]|uniref:Phytanoyl-CoA hydroxylase n=1 Tax=Escovopsis weberi TaxID=150374 RepID=A0A0M9VX64_ESCWE|nr:hypothetical protein ESCO_003930 [Escovopsis weberi]
MAAVMSLSPSSVSDLPELFVNDGKLEQDQIGILRPTPLDTPAAEMRTRLARDGYLFIKGLLPRADVLEARARYFEYLSPTGLLKPGTRPVDGVFDPARPAADYPGIGAGVPGTGTATSAAFVDLAIRAHAEKWYDALCKHPRLLEFVAGLSGWGEHTLALERSLLRNNLPGNAAIGVHYDYIFLRHGNDSVLTAWVPIGDVKVEGGGLIYLEKGHVLGQKFEHDFTAKAAAAGMTAEETKHAFNKHMMDGGVLTTGARQFGAEHAARWLVSGYEAGDVVFHDSYMIHASTTNHDETGTIRLATDLRFVNTSQPWDQRQRWTKVYDPDDGL